MDATIQITSSGGQDRISIIGPINEEAEVHLAKVLENAGKDCTINFSKVTFINSLGVRAWINFIRELCKTRKVTFEECIPEIVNQINMIPNFKGNATIKSIYGAFYCEECDSRQNVLFEAGKNLPTGGNIQLPEVKCAKCSQTMEFEEVEDAFFAFAKAG